jgi:hypothetical protein
MLIKKPCQYCGEPYTPRMESHRFCCEEHRLAALTEERRKAMAAWRQAQARERSRAAAFYLPTITTES